MYSRPQSTSIQGFSLLEMAIVMTIVGLLVGGVLTGKSLIRAAELRAFQTEISQYQIALSTFNNKYAAMPGDMSNATDFWGAANAAPATCQTTSTGTVATCDGNGDGHISDFWLNQNRYEVYRAWQQLANAGLIKGNYTGIPGSTTNNAWHVLGVNCPKSAANPSLGYSLFYTSTNNPGFYTMAGHTILTLGGQTSGWEPNDGAFTPQEMYLIDQKMDDGKPGQGKIVSVFGTTADPVTAQYDTTSDTIITPLIYILD